MRRLIPFLFCAVSTLQVISDPYKGLRYEKVNAYDIENVYLEDCIHVTLGDGYGEGEETEEDYYASDKAYEEETYKRQEVPYYIMDPRAWWK
jgi:hypothetical protein